MFRALWVALVASCGIAACTSTTQAVPQEAANQGLQAPVAPSDDRGFMAAWHGTWKGALTSIPERPGAPIVDVTLEIDPGEDLSDQCLTWRSTFQSDGAVQQVKDYQFCKLPDGRLVIDEGGGLLLDVFVDDDLIYSGFTAGGATLFTATRLDGDDIVFDIYFTMKDRRPVEGVVSYGDGGIQRTVFQRVE
ncbi:MAG: hypothetical protein AAFR65_13505 [Pseudomonadota bacterium]